MQIFKTKTKETKDMNVTQLIEQIHDDFYTEVDKLIISAKSANSLETNKQELLDKCERLTKLGFTNTKEVLEARKEITRLEDLKKENLKKERLFEAINYFSVKYPTYKFITEDSVKKICEKYTLFYSTIDNYIGTVPDKNLKHIEDFKISNEDRCCTKKSLIRGREDYCSYREYELSNKKPEDINSGIINGWVYHGLPSSTSTINICKLEIVAPEKDFDTKNLVRKGEWRFGQKEVEIPDPIVLQPVLYHNEKYYLIITAWGEEASDSMVVNHLNN